VTKLRPVIASAALLAGGAVLGWLAFRGEPAAQHDDVDFEIAALRATLSEHSLRIERLEKGEPAAPDVARLRAALDAQAARIARLEDRASPAGAPAEPSPVQAAERAAKALEQLESITDGSRTIAIADAVAALVRAGDDAVPGVAALLGSGRERDYGGRFAIQGNAVTSYPGLRMALFDVLRQIGTPSARQVIAEAVAKSDRLADFRAVSLFWTPGTEVKDPALAAAFSSLASTLAGKVASEGLEATADTPSSPVSSVLYWLQSHPSADDSSAVEKIVLRGRPKSVSGGRAFEAAFRTLVQLAPERAVQAMQTLRLEPWEVVELASRLNGVSRANQVRCWETVLAQPGIDAGLRARLYERMPHPDSNVKDAAQRAADMQPIVAFLEARIAVETDGGAKSGAAAALERLREALR